MLATTAICRLATFGASSTSDLEPSSRPMLRALRFNEGFRYDNVDETEPRFRLRVTRQNANVKALTNAIRLHVIRGARSRLIGQSLPQVAGA
jgi:hypothetical protein